ncbi:MAG: prepilin-type N-terminal cleavage/methylation domain-containing protein [Planctomycetota bacterium]
MRAATIKRSPRGGFTLMELLAVLAIIGIIATLTVPRVTTHIPVGEAAACHTNKAEIEVQAQLWKRVNGSFPSATLNSIGNDLDYFPEGVPTCPVDGTAYTIDTATGLVVGHNH